MLRPWVRSVRLPLDCALCAGASRSDQRPHGAVCPVLRLNLFVVGQLVATCRGAVLLVLSGLPRWILVAGGFLQRFWMQVVL